MYYFGGSVSERAGVQSTQGPGLSSQQRGSGLRWGVPRGGVWESEVLKQLSPH